MAYVTNNNMINVVDNGEVIESFESCGCVYRDLGMCQGCPVCRFDDENEGEDE